MTNVDLWAVPMDTTGFLLEGIDHGIEAHLAWNQRLLRCALLRESPGDDMLSPDAHSLCRFGVWLSNHRHELDTFDLALVERIAQAHRSMHDAVRSMCHQVLQGRAAVAADLQAYGKGQSTMVTLLNELRGLIADAQTHKDLLTGLPLRHGLEYAYALRKKDALREEAQLWLVMIDVDRFKSVNDNHGHAAGDAALKHIAHCLAGCLRQSDALFRFGGEEFLGLFLVHERQGVELLAARVLDAVRTAPLTIESGITLHPTVTVGLARVRADEDLASATERADHAMLLGKARGRGTSVLAPD
jgi:diguanylate cyclase